MAIHLHEDDLPGPRDDGERQVCLTEVVLLLLEVQHDLVVDLSDRDGRNQVPHRYAGIGQRHRGCGQSGAPGARVGLKDFDVNVDRRPGIVLREHHVLERLGDDLGDLHRAAVRAGALPVADREGDHVVLALHDRLRRVLHVSGMALSRAVHRRQDLVLPKLHICGAIGALQHARLYLYGAELVHSSPVDSYSVIVNQFYVAVSTHYYHLINLMPQ